MPWCYQCGKEVDPIHLCPKRDGKRIADLEDELEWLLGILLTKKEISIVDTEGYGMRKEDAFSLQIKAKIQQQATYKPRVQE